MEDYGIKVTIAGDDSDFQSKINSSIAGLSSFNDAFATMNRETKDSFANLANQFTAIDGKAKIWGDDIDVVANKKKALRDEINRLIDSGIAPESKQIQDLKHAYDDLGDSTKKSGLSFASLRDIMQGPIAAMQMLKEGVEKLWTATIGNAGAIEDMTASFTPLVGGAENAKEMIDALNKEAATTPFELEGIGNVAKQLLPVLGNNVKDVTQTFRMLGDTAGGNIEKLDSITRGYVKVLNSGKVTLESLNIITDAGVPIIKQLAESMGVTTEELYKMVSGGKVAADEVTKAFQKMTSEGGIFYNGMNIASETLNGKLSTMEDSFKMAGSAIGDVMLPFVKSLVTMISDVVGGFADWARENDNLATTLKMIVAVGISAAIAGIVSNIGGLISIVGELKTAIMALNTTALMGPTGIIVALGLVAAALIGVANAFHQSELKEIEKDFGGLAKEADMSAEKINKVQEAIANASKGEGTFEEAVAQVKQFSEDLGISEDQVIRIGLASKNVTDEYKKTLKSVQDYNAALKESNKYIIGTKEWIEAQKQAAAAVKTTTTALKESDDWNSKATDAAIARLTALRDAAVQQAQEEGADAKAVYYIKKELNDKIDAMNIQKIKTERDAALAEVENTKENAGIRAEIKKTYEDKITTYQITSATARAKEESDIDKKAADEAEKRAKERNDFENKWATKTLADKKELIAQEEAREIEKAKEIGASEETLSKIHTYYNQKRKEESFATVKAIVDNVKSAVSTIGDVFSKIGGVISAGVSAMSRLIKIDPKTLLTSLQEVLTSITKFFIDTLPKLPEIISSGAKMIAELAKSLKDNIGDITKSAMEIIKALVTAINDNFATIIEAGVNLILSLLDGIGQMMPEIVSTVTNMLTTIFNTLLSALPKLITTGISMIGAIIQGILSAIPTLLQSIADNLPTIILALMNAIPLLLEALTSNIGTVVEGIIEGIFTIAEKLVEFILSGQFLEVLARIVGSIFKGLTDALSGLITGVVNAFISVGSQLINGLIKGIGDGLAGIWNAISNFFQKYLIDPIKNFFGIHSPSTMFEGFGGNMIQGLINGILSAGAGIWNAISGVFTGVVDKIKNVFSAVGDWFTSLFTGKNGAEINVSGGAATIAPDILSHIPGMFANGTDYASGGMAIVGEQGPELVNLPQGSQVITNNNTRELLNDNRTTGNTYHIYAGQSLSAAEIAREVKKTNRSLGAGIVA